MTATTMVEEDLDPAVYGQSTAVSGRAAGERVWYRKPIAIVDSIS